MLLSPFVWRWDSLDLRASGHCMSFHVGIALFVDVGPYSYVMFAFDLLMLPGFWFDRAAGWAREEKGARARSSTTPTESRAALDARTSRGPTRSELLRFVDRSAPPSPSDRTDLPTAGMATLGPDGTWRTGGRPRWWRR